MKKIRKKIALICLLCFSFLLTGCKIGNKEVIVSNTLNNRQVFRIGNVSCGLKEAKVYLVNYRIFTELPMDLISGSMILETVLWKIM